MDLHVNTDRLDDHFEENKEEYEQNVEDFPEDAARWTGEKVCSALVISFILSNPHRQY